MKNKNTEYGMTEQELDDLSERNHIEWKKEKEEMRVLEHSIKTDTSYRGWFEIDRDLIEREMVGRKMTDDEWMEICEELDDTMYDDKMKILLQHTWVGDEYHNRYGAVMY